MMAEINSSKESDGEVKNPEDVHEVSIPTTNNVAENEVFAKH